MKMIKRLAGEIVCSSSSIGCPIIIGSAAGNWSLLLRRESLFCSNLALSRHALLSTDNNADSVF
jgi:hypothetical protein